MSIKPKYVKKILDKTKRYEFRKVIFKNPKIQKILIYSSSPEKKLVGYMEIDHIIQKSPDQLWKICKNEAGIAEEEFFKYFKGKSAGFAIKIKKVVQFKEKMEPIQLIPNFHPPQSYCYTNVLSQTTLTQFL
ncbi:MAG: ASCH domain-containing protein [Promethearchaeota archaeon]